MGPSKKRKLDQSIDLDAADSMRPNAAIKQLEDLEESSNKSQKIELVTEINVTAGDEMESHSGKSFKELVCSQYALNISNYLGNN
jgi:hypothetical protein